MDASVVRGVDVGIVPVAAGERAAGDAEHGHGGECAAGVERAAEVLARHGWSPLPWRRRCRLSITTGATSSLGKDQAAMPARA